MRKAFVVIADLDPAHEEETGTEVARKGLQLLLNRYLGRYNPLVSLAPTELQPGYENHVKSRQAGVVDPEALEFLDRMGALTVYHHIKRLIDEYGHATIGDIYRRTGKPIHYTDHYWGWMSTHGFGIDPPEEITGSIYRLILPKPQHLTETEGNKPA